MGEAVLRIVLAAVVAVIAYAIGVVVPLTWMHWWVAALIGLVVVYGGVLIINAGE